MESVLMVTSGGADKQQVRINRAETSVLPREVVDLRQHVIGDFDGFRIHLIKRAERRSCSPFLSRYRRSTAPGNLG